MEEWRRHRERRKIAPFPFQSTEMSRGSSDGSRAALSAMQLKFNAATRARARRSMMEVHRMCIRSLVLYPFEEGALLCSSHMATAWCHSSVVGGWIEFNTWACALGSGHGTIRTYVTELWRYKNIEECNERLSDLPGFPPLL